MENHLPIPNAGRSTTDVLDDMPREHKIRILGTILSDLAENTRLAYQKAISQFEEICGKNILEADFQDVIRFYQYIKDIYKSGTSIQLKINALSSIFHKASLLRIMPDNPVTLLKSTVAGRSKRKIPKRRSELTWKEINEALQKESNAGIKALILFLAYTGVRNSELRGIRIMDIERKQEENSMIAKITIQGKGSKFRSILLPYSFIEEIIEALNPGIPSGYLFHDRHGNMLTRRFVYYHVTSLFSKYLSRKISPHQLRHFFATDHISRLKNDIKAVSRYLGHSSSKITLDYYVDTELSYQDLFPEGICLINTEPVLDK